MRSKTMTMCVAAAMVAAVTQVAMAAPLEAAMGQMGRALKALKADAPDAAKMTAALKDVGDLQTATMAAKGQLPPSVSAKTGEEKEKAAMEYRTMMVNLLRAELEVEQAIIEKKAEDVTKGLAQIDELMKAGHGEFIPKKQK